MSQIRTRVLRTYAVAVAIALSCFGLGAATAVRAQTSPSPTNFASAAPNLPSSTTSGPMAALPAIVALGGAQFAVTGRATKTVAQKPATSFNSLTGPDEGDRVWPTAGASVSIPFDPKSGFSIFAFWYNIIDYGFTKSVNPYSSFNRDPSNLTQAKVVLTADIHIAFKH